MKIRAGFVSNSSSSSYMIIIEKPTWEKAVATLNEQDQKLVRAWTGFANFAGTEVAVLGVYECDGEGYCRTRGFNLDVEPPNPRFDPMEGCDEDDDYAREARMPSVALDQLKQAVQELGEDYLYSYTGG